MVREALTRVLIVADDLTGSFDTAGPFAQQGLTTMVVAQPLDSDADAVSDARVVSINTDTRHLEPAAAAARVERCVRHFAGQHFDIVFKKIDSTLRGNVATETMALMNVCDRRLALIAPAFPAQGRTVVNGLVHVDGVPLAQTGFAKDALSPPPLKPLTELFAAFVGAGRVALWQHGEPLQFPDEGVIVADAGSDDDMSEVYSKARGHVAQTLLVGSAGLGLVLARSLTAVADAAQVLSAAADAAQVLSAAADAAQVLSAAADAARGQTAEMASAMEPASNKPGSVVPAAIEAATIEPATIEPIVFVVGSRATRSREQVEQLRACADTIVLEAPNGRLAAVPDLRAARQVVVLAVAHPQAGEADAVDVAQQLAHVGLGIVDDIQAGAIVVTGGDTAIAVLDASKCAVIQVGGNLMPGIPYARYRQNGRSIFLVTKAGGFGTPATMVDIVRRLRGTAASVSPLKNST